MNTVRSGVVAASCRAASGEGAVSTPSARKSGLRVTTMLRRLGRAPLGERLEGVAAHHHGVAGGEFLEVLQVLGDVEQEVAAAANGGAVGSYGGYYRNHN